MAIRCALAFTTLLGVALLSGTAGASGEQRLANAWTTNEAGLAILEESEGLRLQSYSEAGSWRIGYGHSSSVVKGMTITAAEAAVYLQADIKVCEAAIGQLVTVPVTQNEFSALVSLCFSTGTLRLKSSTAIAQLNAGNHTGAADAFMLWVKSGGKSDPKLVALRKIERDLFLN